MRYLNEKPGKLLIITGIIFHLNLIYRRGK